MSSASAAENCPNCGEEIRRGMLRCRGCGTTISRSGEIAAIAAAPVGAAPPVAVRPPTIPPPQTRAGESPLKMLRHAVAQGPAGLPAGGVGGRKGTPPQVGGGTTSVPPVRAFDASIRRVKSQAGLATAKGVASTPSAADASAAVSALRQTAEAIAVEARKPAKLASALVASAPEGAPRAATAQEDAAPLPTEPLRRIATWRELKRYGKVLGPSRKNRPRDAQIRQDLLNAIVDVRDPRVTPLVVGVLSDEWVVVREAAAGALGRLGDEAAVGPLIDVLARDDNPDVQRAAGQALAALGDRRGVLPLLLAGAANPRHRVWTVEAIGKFGERALNYLVQGVTNEQVEIREDAALALGRLKDRRAASALVAALADAEPSVRRCAAEALGELHDTQAVAPLLDRLQDSDSGVRANAAGALIKLGSEQPLAGAGLIAALAAALADAEPAVRSQAALALGGTQDPATIDLLCQRLADEHDEVRSAAANALGRRRDARAVLPLAWALSDKAADVRLSATRALGKIPTLEVVPPLIKVLQDDSDLVRKEAAEALGHHPDPRAIGPLGDALNRDVSTEVCLAAARALGRIGDPAALPMLRDALNDEFAVRCRVCAALGQIKAPESAEILIPLLHDPAPEIRHHAAVSLGQIGDKSAIKALEELATDGDPFVLRGLARAFQLLGDPRGATLLEDLASGTPVKAAPAAAKAGGAGADRGRSTPRPAFDWSRLTAPVEAVLSWLTNLVPDRLVGLAPSNRWLALKPVRIGAGIAAAGVVICALWFLPTSSSATSRSAGKNKIQAAAFAGKSSLAVFTTRGELQLWDAKTGKSASPLKTEENQSLLVVGVSPAGETIAGVLKGRAAIVLWNAATGKETGELKGHKDSVQRLQFSADGQRLFSMGNKGEVITWDVAQAKSTSHLTLPLAEARSVALCPEANLIALGNWEGVILMYNLTDGQKFAEIPGHAASVSSLDFSRDGKLLATADAEGGIHVWDLVARKRQSTFEGMPKQVISSIAFNSTATTLAAATETGEIVLWDVGRATQKKSLKPEFGGVKTKSKPIAALVFGHDDQWLAAGSATTAEVAVWDVESGDLKQTLKLGD